MEHKFDFVYNEDVSEENGLANWRLPLPQQPFHKVNNGGIVEELFTGYLLWEFARAGKYQETDDLRCLLKILGNL
ncbi:MAG: hypothetical protein Q7R49_04940 [Candidatus Daviesbacteria bacterium]|nr:hypothetical protein [Candidatus Daviesbacteria bacterium]